MTTFGWKRKTGDKLSRDQTSVFASEIDLEDKSIGERNFPLTPKFRHKRARIGENSVLKSNKLKEEGVNLADRGRYGEAIECWDQALLLTPSDSKILEMKAQALLQLNQVFPALQAARKAVMVNPQWWIAHQTLGRAQLGMGEIKMAIISFCKALHINPDCEELWEADLKWASKLLQEKEMLDKQLESKSLETNVDTNRLNHQERENQ